MSALVPLLADDRAEMHGCARVGPAGGSRAVLDHHAAYGVRHLRHANASCSRLPLVYLSFRGLEGLEEAPDMRAESLALLDGWLAVDVANTVECPGCRGGDAFVSPGDASRWIQRRFHEHGLGVTSEDLLLLRRFRGDLRAVLAAAVDRVRPPPAVVARLNRAARRSPTHPSLQWRHGRWVATEESDFPSAARRLINLTARSAIGLLAGPNPTPVRRCQGPGCIHYIIAHRPQQRWCSPTGCGNRARVQRHYRKLRSQSRRRPASRRARTKSL